MATVSLIMPAYNSGKYLRETIESILAQTYKDWELILVNDGSKDDTLSIAKDIAQKEGSGRIKVISKPNSGVSDTRNKGIALSSGKYLMFIDSDDQIKEDYIETFINIIEQYDCDLVISPLISSTTIIPGIYKYSEVYNNRNLVWGQPWCKLFKADIVKENNIVFNASLKLCEDWIFTMDYLDFTVNIYILDYAGYGWNTDNTNSLSRGCDYQYRLDCYEVALERLHKLFISKGIEDTYLISKIKNDNWKVAIYSMYAGPKRYSYTLKIQRIKQFLSSQKQSSSLLVCFLFDLRIRITAFKNKIRR